MLKQAITLLLLLAIFPNISIAAGDEEEPPKVGNFIVPGPQQPGSLISFGENVVTKNEKQIHLFTDYYAGVNQHFMDAAPAFNYGITDNLAILIATPIAVSYREGSSRSSGIEDAVIQLEYGFYNHSTKCYVDQASIVANMTFPTGSANKDPNTGIGSPGYFIGFTFERIYADWFMLTSQGAIFPTQRHGTKFGENLLYQFGLGRNIMDINGWVIAWLTELTGTYYARNQVSGEIDPDSGGNVIYLTPSFWASNNNIIFQLGVGYAVQQHLFGDQARQTFLVVSDFRWSFF